MIEVNKEIKEAILNTLWRLISRFCVGALPPRKREGNYYARSLESWFGLFDPIIPVLFVLSELGVKTNKE